jgi:hypothetical protein
MNNDCVSSDDDDYIKNSHSSLNRPSAETLLDIEPEPYLMRSLEAVVRVCCEVEAHTWR